MSKSYEVSGETTEWEDILIKKGITTKESVLLGKGLDPNDFLEKEDEAPEPAPVSLEERLENATLDEIDSIEDQEDDDRILQQYREKRLAALKEAQRKNKFGEVKNIAKCDWVKEVTVDSNSCWVVAHLYESEVVDCQIMDEALMVLAKKFPMVKFVRIQSTHAVEKWPSRNLPTLFIYHNGELQHQLMTLRSVGGTSMLPDDLEWWLAEKEVLETELEEKPHRNERIRTTHIRTDRRQHEDYSDDDSI